MEDVMSRWLLNSSSTTSNPVASSKRKFSQDSETVDPPKRIKCSPLSPSPQATSTTSGGGGGGIATNTIMITNNYSSKNGLPATTSTTSNSSQITILAQHDGGDHDDHPRRPMVVDQINICINNHFSSDAALLTTTASATTTKTKKMGYEAEVKEADVVVDVEEEVKGFTIKKEPQDEEEEEEREKMEIESKSSLEISTKSSLELVNFSLGEEVLVPRSSDSCFYLGILTVLREDQCLVQFDDGSNCWSSVGEIKRLLRPANTVYCVLCKTREEQRDDEGAATRLHSECVHCGRVYHRVCLQKELNQLIGTREDAIRVMEKTKCLRCFKRAEGIDQHKDVTDSSESSSGVMKQRVNNSSNTGKSTTNASNVTVGHHQLEVGAPSMDWFKKEVRGGSAELEEEDNEIKEEQEDQMFEEEENESNNRRRLRRREKKKNYKDIQRIQPTFAAAAATTNNSSSWSCASSTTSSSSSSLSTSGGILILSQPRQQPQFTLEELRWAFLPKSHKSFRRRSGLLMNSNSTSKSSSSKEAKRASSGKVPYTTTTASRRASREVMYTNGKEENLEEEENSVPGEEKQLSSSSSIAVGSETTKARLARGEKFVVRARRQDARGNVQYLVEWCEVDED